MRRRSPPDRCAEGTRDTGALTTLPTPDPPARAAGPGPSLPAAAAPRLLGVPEELVALACYAPLGGAGPFVSLLVLLFARRRAWLRWHACQSLALAALATAIVVGLWLGDFALEAFGLWSPGLVAVALQLAAAALYVGLSVRSMILAYQRRDAALPWIGARARRWAGVRGDEHAGSA